MQNYIQIKIKDCQDNKLKKTIKIEISICGFKILSISELDSTERLCNKS